MSKNVNGRTPDFSGYVTRSNVRCSDGRTILPDAFKEQDGAKVPLVWSHDHKDLEGVLGHIYLENRDDGVYGYGFLNDTVDGKRSRILIQHGDLTSLSIWANNLVEKQNNVIHGKIREVSLVLAGANPGAFIDHVAVSHSDGGYVALDDEAIIYSGKEFTLAEYSEEDELNDIKDLAHAEGASKEEAETVGEVFSTLSEKQKDAVYAIIGQLLDGDQEGVEHSDSDEGDNSDMTMKKNVFDGTAADGGTGEGGKYLSHEMQAAIFQDAMRIGSLHEAVIKHAGTYGIDNIDYLFPEAKTLTQTPDFISRRMEWVNKVISKTRHSPFSRIKSLHADITADEARARGYVTGAQKTEEVFPILRRTTAPTTIYKKQRLDRDDIIDITDFSVVMWMKGEMRLMLEEEIARAVLVGDGRSGADPDKVDETCIRPIWQDDVLYCISKQVAVTRTASDLIDDLITARIDYRGSGTPTLFVPPTQLNAWLLMKDANDHRLYKNRAELASELDVDDIVAVPVMEGLMITGTPNYLLRGLLVNLNDYTIGADKGGEVTMFDDFDLDYNQYKYLIETRMSGALRVPKSAIALTQADA